jgi:hypothetical protein
MKNTGERGMTDGDPKYLGMSMDDLNACFEHKKQISKDPSMARQSTLNLQAESKKDKIVHDFSGLDARSLDREIVKAKTSADLVKLISVLQAKTKLKSLSLLERKKVLLELLLELLNARKLYLIDDHMLKHRDMIAQEAGADEEALALAFDLMAIIVKHS